MPRKFPNIQSIIGDLEFPNPTKRDVRMYSFDKPARPFWQGVYQAARKMGLSHNDALCFLQSSYVRHMWEEDDELIKLGEKVFRQWQKRQRYRL